jgi:16S rRNA processing protein RimM
MGNSLLWVGRIVKTQGIKGEVRLFASGEGGTGPFSEGTVFYLRDQKGTEKKRLTVKSSRNHRSFAILGFKEIRSAEEAKELVGCSAYIAKENLAPLPPDEFYAYQLIGLQVKTDRDVLLGTLEEILPTGSNDVFVVRRDGQEILLPATDEVIIRVELEKKEMTVRLLEGLMPEDDF